MVNDANFTIVLEEFTIMHNQLAQGMVPVSHPILVSAIMDITGNNATLILVSEQSTIQPMRVPRMDHV